MLSVATQRESVYAAMSAWEGMDDAARALRLRAALIHAGLTQSDLMRLLDVSQTIISKWANARGELSWPRWLSICQLAELPISWVPTDEELWSAWSEARDEAKRHGREPALPEPPKPAPTKKKAKG
jgi:transcriptional regulator with XRE-family HTH domain